MASSRRTKKKTTRKKSRSRKTTRRSSKKAAESETASASEQAVEPQEVTETVTAVEEAPAEDSTGPMDVLFADPEANAQQAQQQSDDEHAEWKPNLYELHDLVQQLGQTVQQQWREMQEATRSLDELRSHSPRRSDVMEGRTYLSQDMRALVEPLQEETQRLNRRMQWCFAMLLGLALVAVPALLKVLFS